MALTRRTPPCPGDPGMYVLVHTKRGKYWRLKRFTHTPVSINPIFRENAQRMGVCSRLSGYLFRCLNPFLENLDTANLHSSICGRFLLEGREKGSYSLSCLKGIEFHAGSGLDVLMKRPWKLTHNPGTKIFQIVIDIPEDGPAIKVFNQLFHGYRFVAVLLYGSLEAQDLREISVCSEFYEKKSFANTCLLRINYPEQLGEYLLCLRAESYETDGRLSVRSGSLAMRAIDAGFIRG